MASKHRINIQNFPALDTDLLHKGKIACDLLYLTNILMQQVHRTADDLLNCIEHSFSDALSYTQRGSYTKSGQTVFPCFASDPN